MTAKESNTVSADNSDATTAQYTADHGEQMDTPAAILRLEGDGPQSVATDATVDLSVDETGRLELTLTADFEAADRLLNRDLLTAVLAGKDLK